MYELLEEPNFYNHLQESSEYITLAIEVSNMRHLIIFAPEALEHV
ncbi:hypothetical protein [Priestia megaterium]|nr:hypothetical protein [Priestia megaterium]